jgi:hypothetical protein
MTVTDWPDDTNLAPHTLVGWRRACSDLDVSSNTLLRLCARNGVGIVVISRRRRALLARDLQRIVQSRTRSANTYAAAHD